MNSTFAARASIRDALSSCGSVDSRSFSVLRLTVFSRRAGRQACRRPHAHLEGRSIVALARDHGVSRGAIRTAVADHVPDNNAISQEDTPAPELPVTSTYQARSRISSARPT
ncbi:hypothetical protein ACIP3U_32110 [[Kitasatospora] papulosa]|uniref:hypothetical protein n=1 Tax=[Kitasatospora] papulosa TaxID=1464011 RepID=UPI0038108C1A